MKFSVASAVVFAGMALTSPAWAGVVDFGTGATPDQKIFTCWNQAGMSMCPVNIGSSFSPPHWDLVSTGPAASASDNNAQIHRGQGGEEVKFTYAGGAFDLDSIDIENIHLLASNLDVTFAGYSGTSLVASLTEDFHADTPLTINFGWSDIDSFTISVPLGNYSCQDGQDCSQVQFDNVVFDAAPTSNVPEPLTLSLFGAGLVGAVALRRRRKSA